MVQELPAAGVPAATKNSSCEAGSRPSATQASAAASSGRAERASSRSSTPASAPSARCRAFAAAAARRRPYLTAYAGVACLTRNHAQSSIPDVRVSLCNVTSRINKARVMAALQRPMPSDNHKPYCNPPGMRLMLPGRRTAGSALGGCRAQQGVQRVQQRGGALGRRARPIARGGRGRARGVGRGLQQRQPPHRGLTAGTCECEQICNSGVCQQATECMQTVTKRMRH